MERNANYALVGFASLVLFFGLIVFVVWFARVSFSQQYDIYDVLFTGPVNGLSQGGEVHFNGIKVGEISQIALDKDDPKNVVARVRVTSDVPIRADSLASIEPQGITGVSFIQITPGTTRQPLLKNVPHSGKYPILHSQSSAISNLLQGGGTVLVSVQEALRRVNEVLSDDNIKKISGTLDDISAITAEARKRKQLFADADQALKSIDTTAGSIQRLSDNANGLLNGDGKRAIRNAADAAVEIKQAAASGRVLIEKLQGPTMDFADNGLPQLTSAVATLQQTAQSMNRLANELEESPQSLITKAPAKEVEVKP
ncbi:MAG TPA: MlaD family protein [Caulobacteraceae bacterium]|jgi:phospholipid/cholesterol/gamma-HCH transport system substrate-binding protein|nr:MlaD family protein [Caulobacteraceae bacterium]